MAEEKGPFLEGDDILLVGAGKRLGCDDVRTATKAMPNVKLDVL